MSWVNDFNSISSSGAPALPPGKKSNIKRKETAADKLKAELKLLEWHKLANDAAIKAAIMQTKQLKQQSEESSPSYIENDAHWIRRVINNEQTKPLEVSKDFVVQHEKAEKIAQERIDHQVHHHLDVIKSIRGKLEDRAELRSRTFEFREWKKEFSSKKYAVLSGKTVEDFKRESRSAEESREVGASQSISTTNGPMGGSSRANKAAELTAVLKSIDKLNELEKRISSLESDNAHARMLESEAPAMNAGNERLALEFRKKVKGEGGVSRAVYAVRERKQGWEATKPRGAGANAVRSSRGGGTFLTDMGTEDDTSTNIRDKQRMERLREQSLQPAGKKNLRFRVQTKKIRTKEAVIGKKRHEEALAELKRRKAESAKKVHQPRQKLPPVVAKKGASAGVKTNNKYLADFQRLKQGHAKKKEVAPERSRTSAAAAARPPSDGRTVKATSKGTVTRKSQTVPVRPPRASVDKNVKGLGGGLPPLGAVGNGYNGAKVVKNSDISIINNSNNNKCASSSSHFWVNNKRLARPHPHHG